MEVSGGSAAMNQQQNGSHVLIVTAGLSGLLYSSIELARRLAAAGHRITYAGPSSASQLAEHHGLGFFTLEPSRYKQFLEEDVASGRLHRLLHLHRRRVEARGSLALGGFVDALASLEPDLILIDGEMHEHIIAASARSIPMALLNTFSSIWRQPGLPPPHCLVRPGVGWRGSPVAIRASWLALLWRKKRRAIGQAIRRVGCDRLSLLRHLARETGFDFDRETDDSQWLIPLTYRNLPVLSLHALEFEFPHRPPERVQYTGPMMLVDRVDHPISRALQIELEAILQRHQETDRRSRLIYAGFGSAFTTEVGFLRRLMHVVVERPGWELLISLGDQLKPEDLGTLPKGVHAYSWIPQVRVLQHADVAVIHGGINTLDECILNEVPMLIYCGKETDMAGNTARAVHHGVAIAGDRDRDSTATIRLHLDSLLDTPGYADNVRQLRAQYVKYADNLVAERVVDSLLANGLSFGPVSHRGEVRP